MTNVKMIKNHESKINGLSNALSKSKYSENIPELDPV